MRAQQVRDKTMSFLIWVDSIKKIVADCAPVKLFSSFQICMNIDQFNPVPGGDFSHGIYIVIEHHV